MSQATRVIGLTGGIGTGKSRVSQRLRELGAAVECSDEIVRELQSPGGRALAEIAEAFGREYLTRDGALDRERLGALVFSDPTARRRLNGIVHPLVYGELRARAEKHRAAGRPLVVLDIPLLLEGRRPGDTRGGITYDAIVLVYARESTQVERVIARDGLSREAALARVRAQMPIDEKRALADVVIDNDGPWEETLRQVDALYARVTQPLESATARSSA
jgi:dephospho-CoA kinase